MRTNNLSASIAIAGMAMSVICAAAEIYRLQIDLDGDSKPEIVQISTAPSKEDGRSRVIVKIGNSSFSDEFFSADSELPDIRVIAIDWKRTQRQLLLETPEAGACIYHLLAYTPNKLIRLLRFDSGPNCQPPQPLGNGEVSVSTWQGFWAKEDRYRLSKDGLSLIVEPQDFYQVRVAGAAAKAFRLEGAECPARSVPRGIYVRIKLFDPKKDRYRIESSDGGCGWIPAVDLNTEGEIIKELPWAG
jgi:hypothetical protein